MNKSSGERSLAPKAPLWLLALNMGCGTLGITIISPALGLVTNDFGVDEATGQWVLSAYFGAIALVQLFYGPLSDRFGRKIPLLSGLTLYGLGGFLGAYAPSIETLIAARVIQGLGGGSIISIIRAIINDSYERLEAAGAFALISGIMVVVPIFSFISGGLLGEMIGWQGTMFLIGIAGGIAGILNYSYLHETNLYKLEKLNPLGLFRNYMKLLVNRNFNAFMMASACNSGIFFSMIGFLPYEFARRGFTSMEFGFWFALSPFGYMIGNFMTRFWVKKLGIEMMTLSGSLISLVSMFALLGFDFLGWMHPLWIALPSMIYGISAGLVIGNGSMGAVYAAGHLAGSASGMIGAVQMGFGVLSGSLVVLAGGYESLNHGIQVLIGFSLVSVIFSMMTSRQKTVEAI
ncbi:MAG: MFS transporter [bacterium]